MGKAAKIGKGGGTVNGDWSSFSKRAFEEIQMSENRSDGTPRVVAVVVSGDHQLDRRIDLFVDVGIDLRNGVWLFTCGRRKKNGLLALGVVLDRPVPVEMIRTDVRDHGNARGKSICRSATIAREPMQHEAREFENQRCLGWRGVIEERAADVATQSRHEVRSDAGQRVMDHRRGGALPGASRYADHSVGRMIADRQSNLREQSDIGLSSEFQEWIIPGMGDRRVDHHKVRRGEIFRAMFAKVEFEVETLKSPDGGFEHHW